MGVLVDVLIRRNLIDYVRVECFHNYLKQFGDVCEEQQKTLALLLEKLDFTWGSSSTVWSLVKCSFENKMITSIHISILMKVKWCENCCSFNDFVDFKKDHKMYSEIHDLMSKLKVELSNFHYFPHPGVYMQCSAGEKMKISLVGGDGSWPAPKIKENFLFVPKICDGIEVGVVYPIICNSNVRSLYDLCFAKIRKIDF